MKVKRLVGKMYAGNCYLVFFNQHVIIIDPCVSYHQIKSEIKGHTIFGIFITHGHADHFYYLDEIKKYTQAKIYCHKNAKEKIEDSKKNYSVLERIDLSFVYPLQDYEFVKEGMSIKVDDKEIQVIETPGHSNCSVCYIIDEAMFSGDTLFFMSVGRCDLYSGDEQQMKASLERLKKLDKNYIVYPGHEQATTLHDEIESSRYFRKSYLY